MPIESNSFELGVSLAMQITLCMGSWKRSGIISSALATWSSNALRVISKRSTVNRATWCWCAAVRSGGICYGVVDTCCVGNVAAIGLGSAAVTQWTGFTDPSSVQNQRVGGEGPYVARKRRPKLMFDRDRVI